MARTAWDEFNDGPSSSWTWESIALVVCSCVMTYNLIKLLQYIHLVIVDWKERWSNWQLVDLLKHFREPERQNKSRLVIKNYRVPRNGTLRIAAEKQ